MQANIKTNLIDWDYDGPEALEPRTPVEVTLEPHRIEVELVGDQKIDPAMPTVSNRSVVLEMQNDDGLRVLIYGFDQDEPRVFCVGLDGEITEKS